MRNRWPLRLILLVFRWLKKVLSRLVTLLRGPRRKSGDVELAFHNDQSAEIASLKKTLLEAEEKASNAKAASEAYSAQIHDLQLQLREERARPEGVGPDTARERGHLQQQLNDKSAHLEQLIRESLAAQKWMSVRDTVTEIHIVEAAQGLNHISSEIATNLSEKLSLAYSKAPSFREHMPPFFPSRVCHHAIAKLDSVDHRESSTLLEIAIAGVVTDFVYEVTTRWNIYLGGGAVLQTSLSRAFDALYRGEIASIAGNWRALAHRYLNRQDLPTTSQDESAKDTLYNDLLSLLIPFALPFYSNHEEAVMKLESHVAYLLVDLVQALKKFNCDILENMISCSIIPSIAVIHTSYDSSTMQDGWATGEELQAGEMSEVLCSTGIGLRRRTRNDNGDIDEQLLIPPTVALHAVFDVLPVVSAKHDGSTLNY